MASSDIKPLIIAVWVLAAAWLFPTTGLAQGKGSQINFLTPVDLHSLTLGYLETDTNFRFGQTDIGNADISANTASMLYAYRFDFGGRFAQVTAGLAYLDLKTKGRLQLPGGEEREREFQRKGLGDPTVSFRYGLYGAPALTRQEWEKADKGFQVYGELGASLPWGDYSSTRIINPGFNRFGWNLSLPMVIPLDGIQRKAFLEFTPQVLWFGDNNDAPGRVETLAQDPLYTFELQASRIWARPFWTSIGVQYQAGGATVSDGIADNNELDQFYWEFGAGYAFSKTFALSATYGRIFGQENNTRGQAWRVRLLMIP